MLDSSCKTNHTSKASKSKYYCDKSKKNNINDKHHFSLHSFGERPVTTAANGERNTNPASQVSTIRDPPNENVLNM